MSNVYPATRWWGIPSHRNKKCRQLNARINVNKIKLMALIKNVDKAARTIDFSGLNKSKSMSKHSVYATDIDGLMEFGNEHIILFEVKEHGRKMSHGQSTAFERLVDAWNYNPGKKGLLIYATHDPEAYGAIPIEDCEVQAIYGVNGWSDTSGCLLEVLQTIGKNWNINKLKSK